ncbi:hypothetical protein A5904_05690 [Acidithiobacillus caldus]|uniref:Uncharacterized protein n=1 Tax=Acidithiobacillus caldus (strain SM-1) TaxID=990288 RepID=F9ZMR7_ACICS|nr:hypothetical protein [Acidithiobacillus caldus]AEK57827.1 conserved hypothetical protein [Acidithiobacillus caldus SM-1]AUW32521.1 hypothetical protein A5904_05690 [Acidithiobacillus caldus]QER44964.1 hypothetical protein F0726_01904 [Acidithiobacillus caldus]
MTEMVRSEQQFLGNRVRKWVPYVAGAAAMLVADAALAATGGPFASIGNFIQQNFMPAIGSIGIAGGIGYGAIHAFKHDYGKAIVGIGTAAGGGFVIHQYGWFGQQAGIQAATLGGHITVASALGHALGLL